MIRLVQSDLGLVLVMRLHIASFFEIMGVILSLATGPATCLWLVNDSLGLVKVFHYRLRDLRVDRILLFVCPFARVVRGAPHVYGLSLLPRVDQGLLCLHL